MNAASGVLVLRGLHITGNTLNANYGINVNSVGSLTIDHVLITNNQYGIFGANGVVLVKSSLINANTYGVANYGDTMFMGQTIVSGNTQGVIGATLNSYGDNDMNGNTECDVCATINQVPHDQ